MIDIKSLRVGAHIKCGDRHRITAIDALNNQISIEAYQTDEYGVKYPRSYKAEDVEPIPLTPELLAELGFKIAYRDIYPEWVIWRRHIEGYTIEASENDTPNSRNWSIRVKNPIRVTIARGNIAYLHEIESIIYQCTGVELIEE